MRRSCVFVFLFGRYRPLRPWVAAALAWASVVWWGFGPLVLAAVLAPVLGWLSRVLGLAG